MGLSIGRLKGENFWCNKIFVHEKVFYERKSKDEVRNKQ